MPSKPDPSSASLPGDVLSPGIGPGSVLDGRYRLESLVGRGGTAAVYRAIDELLGRTVAVKMFNPDLTDPVMVTRQYQEMRVVAALQHPHLVAVYDARMRDAEDVAAGNGTGYLVLEFVDGPSLAERLNRDGMSPVEVADVGAAIASALHVVHGGGLVHRDIKPGNILLTSTGQPKLSDFGIARALHAERITSSADVLGTAPYLSPEQARGSEVGAATDIYALGLVLLECLTGHREYPGPAIEAAVARLLRDPVIPDTLPPPWPGLLQSMTSREPEARPTAADVAATLDREGHQADSARNIPPDTATGQTKPATPATIVDEQRGTPLTLAEPDHRPRRRPMKALILTGAGAVIAVAATLAVVTSTQDQPNPSSPTPDTGGTVISSPAPTPPATIPVGQPATVVVTATPSSDPQQPAATQPTDQTPNTPVITSDTGGNENGGNNGNGNGNGNGGDNGNGNNGNGNNGNGGNNENGNGR